MIRPRFSISTLMAFVLASAVGLAALRNADEFWAGLMMSVAYMASGVAALGGFGSRGREQSWWLGFAVFCGGYLALTCEPVASTKIGPRLLTAQLLDHVHSQVTAPPPMHVSGSRTWAQVQAQRRGMNIRPIPRHTVSIPGATVSTAEFDLSMLPANRWRSLLTGAADLDAFRRVGHSLFALLLGLAGGSVAAWFHARREREAPSG